MTYQEMVYRAGSYGPTVYVPSYIVDTRTPFAREVAGRHSREVMDHGLSCGASPTHVEILCDESGPFGRRECRGRTPDHVRPLSAAEAALPEVTYGDDGYCYAGGHRMHGRPRDRDLSWS